MHISEQYILPPTPTLPGTHPLGHLASECLRAAMDSPRTPSHISQVRADVLFLVPYYTHSSMHEAYAAQHMEPPSQVHAAIGRKLWGERNI